MPTFDTIRQGADNRALIRKIQKAVMFLGRSDATLPATLFEGGPTTLVDLKAAGFVPVGLVTPDGYTFSREISKEDVFALGYASASRSDITQVPRQITFTAYENAKKHMLEMKYGTNLDGVTQDPTTGEIVFEEPDLPIGEEYKAIVIGSDGPADDNWIIGKGYGSTKLASTGEETWGQEGAQSQEYTLDVFQDETVGAPVRHYMGGTGPLKHAVALGFAAPDNWSATTAYTTNDTVILAGGEVLRATNSGTSAATEPTAPAVGGTVVDGDITWERVS